MELDTVVHRIRIRYCGIVLCRCDKAQFQHIVQTGLPPRSIGLGVIDGIMGGRVLGNGGNDRAFGQGQFTAGFAEIPLGSRLHAQSILAQVDGVHVAQQYLILWEFLGNGQGKILLLELTLYHFYHISVFFRPCGEDGVLQKLLGDGAGAFFSFSHTLDEVPAGADDSLDVDAVMLVKTLVLQSHERLPQMLGDQVHAVDLDAVGVHTDILIDLIALAVIDDGGFPRGRHIA